MMLHSPWASITGQGLGRAFIAQSLQNEEPDGAFPLSSHRRIMQAKGFSVISLSQEWIPTRLVAVLSWSLKVKISTNTPLCAHHLCSEVYSVIQPATITQTLSAGSSLVCMCLQSLIPGWCCFSNTMGLTQQLSDSLELSAAQWHHILSPPSHSLLHERGLTRWLQNSYWMSCTLGLSFINPGSLLLPYLVVDVTGLCFQMWSPWSGQSVKKSQMLITKYWVVSINGEN